MWEENRKLEDMLREMTSTRRHRHEPLEAAAPLPSRILIVVENRLVGRQLARLLISTGYGGVRAVNSATRALLVARHFKPHIIFLDVALADDAYGLARDLRQRAGRDDLRLIALTRGIEHSTREQARSAGFERWLVTPVVPEDLDRLMRANSESA